MKNQKPDTACPRCGRAASDKFCSDCGATLSALPCATCGTDLAAGARFCHHCGAPASSMAGKGRAVPPAWVMVVSVLVVLAAFIAGQRFGGMPASGGSAPPLASGGGLGAAPDISNMSPQEAASRLFDRVMRYSSEGKADSAALFAPMAILAYERVGPLDAHARYDVGTISVTVGDAAAAAAQADTILRQNPSHLLGLILAARAADAANDRAAAARFRSRLVAVASTERAKAIPEYTDHQRDIDDALKSSGAGRP